MVLLPDFLEWNYSCQPQMQGEGVITAKVVCLPYIWNWKHTDIHMQIHALSEVENNTNVKTCMHERKQCMQTHKHESMYTPACQVL